MGSTLLIPLGLGPVIRANNLPHLPSIDHGEVFRGFPMNIYLERKIVIDKIMLSIDKKDLEILMKKSRDGKLQIL